MTYLKLGENKSKNEIAEINWQNFYNSISHQLNLRRENREEPEKFLTDTKQQYDRLFELSPMPLKSFIAKVKKVVSTESSDDFQVPTYLNGFHHTEVWREPDESFEDNNSLLDEVQPDVPVV